MRLGLMVLFIFCIPHYMQAQIVLFTAKGSDYSILLPESPTSMEKQAAEVLKHYLQVVSKQDFPLVSGSKIPRKHRISIGATPIAARLPREELPSETFRIQVQGQDLFFQGTGKGLLYGVYHFIENQLGCHKWAAGIPASCPELSTLVLEASYSIKQGPAFQYREVYFPVEADLEYVNWHKIHRLEDLWGWWGHTFSRMVPGTYFKTHPEYFAYFNGARRPDQLCLSNPEVLKLSIAALEKAIQENPEATFWSISPNDDLAYCTCDLCAAVDQQEGGPQGSLIRFVNKIAAHFPRQHFTTLAYLSTANPPKLTRPLPNVTIMLSSIDAARTLPIAREPSAAAFRRQASGWKAQSPRVFVWDYYTQFTNYLSPFPNIPTFQDNLQYYQALGIQGIFAQGSGYTYSDMAELKSYLLAKLLWNPNMDVDSLKRTFIEGFYGNAADKVSAYIDLLEKHAATDTLDIYGNPINAHKGYLSPENMDAYSAIMDQAEGLVENNAVYLDRIQKIRLTQEYTFLQQSRFYGIHKHGIFIRDDAGEWQVRDGMQAHISEFVKNADKYGILELSEGGNSPQAYLKEWSDILQKGVRPNDILDAAIIPGAYPYVPEYPARGWKTLLDGNPGYQDFSYNWLCFYGKPMEVTLDLHEIKVLKEISMDFLEDARHWIFPPTRLEIWGSRDGSHFEPITEHHFETKVENYTVSKRPFSYTLQDAYRFIKIKATPAEQIPAWRYHSSKRPMMACDEIWIQTQKERI